MRLIHEKVSDTSYMLVSIADGLQPLRVMVSLTLLRTILILTGTASRILHANVAHLVANVAIRYLVLFRLILPSRLQVDLLRDLHRICSCWTNI